MREIKVEILENKEIAENIYALTFSVPSDLAKEVRPGQFVNLSTGEQNLLLKRPLGVCRKTDSSVTVCYQVKGVGTRALCLRKRGDVLSALLPLGNGFYLKPEEKKVALIGGGVGVFPLLSVAEGYQGRAFTSYLGFRNQNAICFLNEFAERSRVVLGTDDGSVGEKKNAVQLFLEDYEEGAFDVIFACGPPVMLKALQQAVKERGVKTPCFVSLEERMGCGIGACLVCVCNLTNGEHARVCKDGPVFSIGEVNL
ncbi:MAG: dihydroorotate dehydrogenase electron transfer subunit [Clostridia bacterium]|nr:dihydroorotate dehydrogenase electron transfer subunit [Clostridia bacterium]